MALTTRETYTCTTEVMKSKFIAIFMPLEDCSDFKKTIAALKKEHNKARHVVYAYRNGVNSKSNDDGEPKGTAGRPLLELLMKRNLDNCAIIVIRYFGGTLLGASRLLRTYVQSGNAAINLANLVEM